MLVTPGGSGNVLPTPIPLEVPVPGPAVKTPNHGDGRNVGLTIDQEQRACYAIDKHFEDAHDRNEMYGALDVWPIDAYQNYLNGR